MITKRKTRASRLSLLTSSMFATSVLLAGAGVDGLVAPGAAWAGGVCTPTAQGNTGSASAVAASGTETCSSNDTGIAYIATGGDLVVIDANGAVINGHGVLITDDNLNRNLSFTVDTSTVAGGAITGSGAANEDGVRLLSSGGNIVLNTGGAGQAGAVVSGSYGLHATTAKGGGITLQAFNNVTGVNNSGIWAEADGTGNVSVIAETNTGAGVTIQTTNTHSRGIYAYSQSGSTSVTTGAGGQTLMADTQGSYAAISASAGGSQVTVNNGASANSLVLADATVGGGSGSATINNTGVVNDGNYGAGLETRTQGGGAAVVNLAAGSVSSLSPFYGYGHAIHVEVFGGAGSATVTTAAGTSVTAGGAVGIGIEVDNGGDPTAAGALSLSGTGNVNITANGTVTSAGWGIDAGTGGAGVMTVTANSTISAQHGAILLTTANGADNLTITGQASINGGPSSSPAVKVAATGSGNVSIVQSFGSVVAASAGAAIVASASTGSILITGNGTVGLSATPVGGDGIDATITGGSGTLDVQTGNVYANGTNAVLASNAGTGTTSVSVANGQVVTGGIGVQTSSVGAATVTNMGFLQGVGANAVLMGGPGASTLVNYNFIDGNVHFNTAGASLADFVGSTINGTASATGTGNTVYLNGSGAGAYNATKFTGFQTLTVNSSAGSVWTYTGSGTYTSGAQVVNGGLLVNGTLTGAADVQTGAILGGNGTISGAVTVENGGVLQGVAGQTLTMTSLALNNASLLAVSLGAPSTSRLFNVAGALTLDGQLNVSNAGSFGVGLYRLIDYSGALTDNGLVIGTTPAGVSASSLSIQTSVAGQVNLIYGAGPLGFWNGSTLSPTGSVIGGAGTWKVGPTNWTDAAGASSGAWTGIFGIFSGTGGAVNIDNTGTAVSATGVQFAVNGYTISGGALTLTGASPTIRVGDGTAAGANFTTTISAPIAGSTGLIKTDLGTLILTGANTYSGGTTLIGGTLSVGADNNLGAAGGLTFAGGNLATTANIATSRAVNLTSAGTINTAGSTTLNLTGALTGSAALTKAGGGLLTLSGANTYSGPISLTGGALVVNGSVAGGVSAQTGTVLSGVGTIGGAVSLADGATLKGVAGQTLTTGALTLSNASIIDATLGAPSTSRLFAVNGALTLDGQLNITSAGGFGVGLYRLIDYTGALTNNGLVIGTTPAGTPGGALTIQTSVSNQVNLIFAASTLQFWNGSTLAPTGVVAGGAGTWKVGPTNWTDASGASSGSWGGGDSVFTAAAGAVTIDNSAGAVNATSLQFASNGYSVGGGALTLTGGAPTIRVGDGTAAGAGYTATISAAVAGTNGLIKTDLGTLVLSGANTYSGGTTINSGTLSVSSDANLGAAGGGVTFNGGTLAGGAGFSSSRTLAFAGAGTITNGSGVVLDLSGPMTGAGAFTKSGAGTVKLSGAGTYSGATTVAGGTLQANGTLGGTVLVQSGARLQGTGTVGATTIASGGTLAPGNSIGTLTVNGNTTFAAGSAYEVEVNAAGQSDLTHATGTATLTGGSVTALAAAGTYLLGTRYTVITADGGAVGTFAGLNQPLTQPFLKLSATYDATHAYLNVARNAASFCSVTTTFNQCAAANGVESLGIGAGLYNTVANLPDAATARGAFDGLSGEVHASLRGAQIEDSRFVRDAAIGRMTAHSEGRVAWGQVFGAQGSADSDGNAARLTRTVEGVFVGADTPVGETWRLGGLVGYSHTSFNAADRLSSGDADSYHLAAYAGSQNGALSARVGAAYSWHSIATTRMIAFPGLTDAPRASDSAQTGQIFGEIAYRLGTDARMVEPFAGLAYVSYNGDGFTETGGAAALKASSGTTQTTFGTVGLRAGTSWTTSGGPASLSADIAWRGAFSDVTPMQTLTFASGGSPFTVAGAPIARNALVVDLNLGMNVSKHTRISVSYAGQIADTAREHALKLGVAVVF